MRTSQKWFVWPLLFAVFQQHSFQTLYWRLWFVFVLNSIFIYKSYINIPSSLSKRVAAISIFDAVNVSSWSKSRKHTCVCCYLDDWSTNWSDQYFWFKFVVNIQQQLVSADISSAMANLPKLPIKSYLIICMYALPTKSTI